MGGSRPLFHAAGQSIWVHLSVSGASAGILSEIENAAAILFLDHLGLTTAGAYYSSRENGTLIGSKAD